MYVCTTTADLGPDFIGWAGVVHGQAVAILSPRVLRDDLARSQALELLRRAGIDCDDRIECLAAVVHGEG